MAKKKGGVVANKEEDSAVLDYLTKTNRPYSATDIFSNLHQKYTKGVIAKALDRLVEDELIMSKAYGKTTIYSAKQNSKDIPSAEDVQDMNKSIGELTERYGNLVNENRSLDNSLASIKNEPTTEESKKLLEKLTEENKTLEERLNKLKDGTVLIPSEKRKRTDEEYENNRKLWKKRRGMFKEIFGQITGDYEGNINDLKEKIGIEEDPIPFEKDPLAL